MISVLYIKRKALKFFGSKLVVKFSKNNQKPPQNTINKNCLKSR